jgi:hypothetical protein
MRGMILAKCMGAALAVAVMAGFAGQASAGLREYCDSYARDVAHRKTNGGLIDKGEGAGKGAIIGGVGGTILGPGVTSDRYKRVYTNAFERCIDNYEGQRVPVQTAETKVTETKVAEIKVTETKATETKVAEKKVAEKKVVKVAQNEATEKAEASAASITKACSRKYRSYDPQKGKYKSYNGKWRPCRL